MPPHAVAFMEKHLESKDIDWVPIGYLIVDLPQWSMACGIDVFPDRI